MANFNFVQLDEITRELMLSEINNDSKLGKLYISERLNYTGQENFESYLIEAVTSGNEQTLENLLNIDTHFNPTYLRQGKPIKMPVNAAKLLSQSEFNRYYIRAICQRARRT